MRVARSVKVISFARLFQVAKHSLLEAEDHEDGSFHNITSSMVFSAFTVEACVHHAAESPELNLPKWKKGERRLRPWERLQRVCEAVGIQYDATAEPFSTYDEMIAFRDLLAHARPEEIEDLEVEVEDGYYDPYMQWTVGSWESAATVENARRFVAAAWEIQDLIRAARPGVLPERGDVGGKGEHEL